MEWGSSGWMWLRGMVKKNWQSNTPRRLWLKVIDKSSQLSFKHFGPTLKVQYLISPEIQKLLEIFFYSHLPVETFF